MQEAQNYLTYLANPQKTDFEEFTGDAAQIFALVIGLFAAAFSVFMKNKAIIILSIMATYFYCGSCASYKGYFFMLVPVLSYVLLVWRLTDFD